MKHQPKAQTMAKFLDKEKPGNYCGYEYDRFLTSEVGFGPRGDYYHLVLVKDGHIIAFGDEQGNYDGGIYASTEFNIDRFKNEKDRLQKDFPELYEKVKDIPLASVFKPGKAIYRPKGKAGEYAEWACNFYTGCSNDCQYCYCKRGVMSHVWSTTPRLKKCFKNEADAIAKFSKELNYYLGTEGSLHSRGLFFSFTTDPLLDETGGLTVEAAEYALHRGVPVHILTKRADGALKFVERLSLMLGGLRPFHKVAIGFTLTGSDELEKNASTTEARIDAMRQIHSLGIRTFASIEPLLDLHVTDDIINCTLGFCDLYKIGLLSGGKQPIDLMQLSEFVPYITQKVGASGAKVYWKNSVKDLLGGAEYHHPASVGADYDIFFYDPYGMSQVPFNRFKL